MRKVAPMNKASIVILTLNNLTYTKECIKSVKKFSPADSEIIVVDNHSTDGTVEWLRSQPGIEFIENAENRGYAAGCNQGIKAAGKNDVLFLNNDTVVTPHWLDNLRACLYSDQSVGAVGAVTNSCSNFQAVGAQYFSLDELTAFANGYNKSDPARWEERVRLIGFCLLVRAEAVKKVGLFDESFGNGNYEDDDYSLRIRKAGYRLMLCGDCYIHHFGSTTFKNERIDFGVSMEQNRAIFTRKWGLDPLSFAVDCRRFVAPYLNRLEQAKNILVINSGCGSGLLFLKKYAPKAGLTGVEKNEKLCVGLSHTADIVRGLDFLRGRRFDAVVIQPVLSGASVPLEKLPALLNEDGFLLAIASSGTESLTEGLRRAFGNEYRIETTGGTTAVYKKPEVSVEISDIKSVRELDFSIDPATLDALHLSYLLRRIENGINLKTSKEDLASAAALGRIDKSEIDAAVSSAADPEKLRRIINRVLTDFPAAPALPAPGQPF